MAVAIKNMAQKVKMRRTAADPTVSASYARTLIDFATGRGAGRQALIERSGIDPSALQNPDGRIPFSNLRSLMGAAKELCGDPAFALHFGADPILYDTTIVGLITRTSESMGEAFREFSRYARLVIEVDVGGAEERFAMLRSGADVWLEDRRSNPADFPELTEATFARLICDSLRLFADRPNYFKAVQVAHAAPAHQSEYERLLKAPVTFCAGRNAVLVDEAWFSAKAPTANRYSFSVFNAHAEALLAELEGSKTTRGAVEQLLIRNLHKGGILIADVAAELNMSAPTLYRRLRREGVTFESVLDELRFRAAARYLHETGASLSETAYLVGFSDAASLSRAYKRWTGGRPRRSPPVSADEA